MKEIFKTFISLITLLLISALVYLAWIVNKGGFSSEYLEKFINDRFKSEEFYTSIKDPKIKFNKDEMRIIIDGKNFKIFSNQKKLISDFKNLKVHINFLPLLTERKLVSNKIEMFEGEIDLPSVFKKSLKVNFIQLGGNLEKNVKNLIIDNFSISIEEDLYEGSLQFNLTESQANGTLTKLARKKIFQGLDLDSKNMKFQVNQDEFNIEGNVTLGGVDFLLKGKKTIRTKVNI